MNFSVIDFDMAYFPAMRDLFSSYFGPNDRLLTSSYTEWLYARNPLGPTQAVVAKVQGQWVGFMALVPTDFGKGTSVMRAYFVVNVLVHPDHHGKNIFGQMIAAAKAWVNVRGAALMGHPNDMAYKSWIRAEMHFHESLKPHAVWPKLLGWGVRVHEVRGLQDLAPLHDWLVSWRPDVEHWGVALSPAYLDWRFLQHPGYRYRLSWVERDGQPIGLVVSRRLRQGVHLVIDVFAKEADFDVTLRAAPWLSVMMRAPQHARSHAVSMWALPVRKAIPFFMTLRGAPLDGSECTLLGLTASDF